MSKCKSKYRIWEEKSDRRQMEDIKKRATSGAIGNITPNLVGDLDVADFFIGYFTIIINHPLHM